MNGLWNDLKRFAAVSLLCCVACLSASAAEDVSVYDRISGGLSALPHRLPGSAEFEQAASVVEKALEEQGIAVMRQKFQTPMPVYSRLHFEVDGQAVPMYPLMPNNAMPVSTGSTPISGELLYCPGKDGDWRQTLQGRIVLLDWNAASRARDAFSEGAKAVVFVGTDAASQWEVSRVLSQYQISYPCFYLAREEAEKRGLLDGGKHTAVLEARSQWRNVEATNLWVHIPAAKDNLQFTMKRPEALLLGARLDTFGMVPGLCRGDRERENVALLAQTLAALAKTPLPRDIYVLFYGASFNAYDGIRNFLFPFAKANSQEPPRITEYAQGLQAERSHLESLLEILPKYRNVEQKAPEVLFRPFHYALAAVLLGIYLIIILLRVTRKCAPVSSFLHWYALHRKTGVTLTVLALFLLLCVPFAVDGMFASGNGVSAQAGNERDHEVHSLLLSQVVARYNRNNYDLSEINRILRKASGEVRETALAEKERLDAERLVISNLRSAIHEDRMTEEMLPSLLECLTEVEQNLRRRIEEIDMEIRTSNGWEQVAKLAAGRTIVGSFFFDFSSEQEPFLPVSRGYENMHSFPVFSTSYYAKFYDALQKTVGPLSMQNGSTPMLLSALSSGASPVNLTTNSLAYLPSTPGLVFRIPGFTFRSVPGRYAEDELPGRREFSLKGLLPALEELLPALAKSDSLSMHSMIADSPSLDTYLNYYFKDGKYYGRQYFLLGPDGKELSAPAAGAVAYLGPSDYIQTIPVAGFSNSAISIINSMGYVRMPAVTVGGIAAWQVTKPKPLNSAALHFDADGLVNYASNFGNANYFKLFRCFGGGVPYSGAPLTTCFFGPLSANNALTDNPFRITRTFANSAAGDAYVYVDQNARGKVYVTDETFLLNEPKPGEKTPLRGISMKPEDLRNLNVHRQGLEDTLALNSQRLESLHRRNIFNSTIETFQDNALQYKKDADASRAKHDIRMARAQELFGQTLAVRAYRPLRNIISDMLKSVLILLILTLPFAFAMERLLICSTNIYKELAGMFLFALGTFLLLYFTHPAFMLSQTPVIIFIAFFVILMSVSVIYIVMSRFQNEVVNMQGINTTAHRAASGGNTMLMAVMVGVSSMRNRPVKTLLTVLTVVLLTFTTISFASFEATEKVRAVYCGDASSDDRIEAFLGSHQEQSEEMMEAIRLLYSPNYDVFLRNASCVTPRFMADTYPQQTPYLYNPVSRKSTPLENIAGVDRREAARNAALRKVIGDGGCLAPDADGVPRIGISEFMAKHLGLAVGDVCCLRNLTVKVGLIFPAAALDACSFLDHAKLAGANFVYTTEAQNSSSLDAADAGENDSSHFIWNTPDMTVLADGETVKQLNGFPHAVVLYPKANCKNDLRQDAVRLAEVLYGIVYTSTTDGVYKYFFSEVSSVSGWKRIAVPLLLGALIIFSSLLGSIADREKEIFTFSALGLSPYQVGCLFFAESAVYAVLGALGGYLLSQVTMTVFTMLAKAGLALAPEMNYSSMSTVYTLLLVMAIVMLSTIYPAIKASRSATPDVARQWKMPPPQGDLLRFPFPFTVSAADFAGILLFIGEFFHNHEDTSLGSFASANVSQTLCGRTGPDGNRLEADISLAPFDLAVSETFCMYAAPSDIPGIDMVCVDIRRQSGSERNFMRGNRRFMDELRYQFLLWRSLSPEAVEHYRALAESMRKQEKEEK